MAVIHNLIIVPALKIDDGTPGAPWFLTGWARTTSAHASLPRTTAWAGTTAGQVVCSRALGLTAGRYCVFSVSIRAIAPQTGTLGIDWRASGGGFLSSTSGAGSDHGVINMTASSTQRFAIIGQVPASGVRADPVINGMDAGGAQVTASMLTEHATLAEAEDALESAILDGGYADGDSPGGTWDGADGESTSTIVRDPDGSGVAELGALVGTGLGVRTSNDAHGVAVFGALFASSGLIPTAQYDRERGRIRVSAAGLAANVVRVVVYSRPLGTRRWTVVRGGKVTVTAGAMARPVDDYEYRAGGGMEYRIDALSNLEGQPEDVVQTAIVSVSDTEARTWLKFIPAPWTNIPVELVVDDWELSRDARSTVHEVSGQSPPIVVSDVHTSTRTAVRFKTGTDEALAKLRHALGQGAPAYLQVPDAVPLPTMYVSVGKFVSRRWGGRESRKYVTTVDIVEVAAPPPSVVPGTITYGALSGLYATYGELDGVFSTYGELAG